jgi:hypothetical protein
LERSKQLLDLVRDTPEDVEKHQVLYHTGNILNCKGERVYSQVVYAKKKGRYTPVVVTSKCEVLPIVDNVTVLVKSGTDNKDIPNSERYHYFDYRGTRYQFTHRLGFNPVHNINHLSNSILDDVINNRQYTKEDLYFNIIKTIKQYFYTAQVYEYDILAGAVVLSYLFCALGRVFYLVFIGAPGAGKTTGLVLLSFLQYNGKFGGKGTVAANVRLIHAFNIALCQDEFDKMRKDEKNLLVGVFNSGFNIYGSYTITNTNIRDILQQVVSFRTFGCKSFTANDLTGFDPSFLDRCYILTSLKSRRSTSDINQLEKEELLQLQQLRDQIFIYTLFNWETIRDTLNNLKKGLEQDGRFGRESDKNSIILGIIQHFKGKPYMLQVKKFLEDKAPVAQLDRVQSMEMVILKTIANECTGLTDPNGFVDIENETLYKALLDAFDYLPSDRYAPSNQKPRKILDNLGLTSKKENLGWVHSGRRVYHINVKQFILLLQEQGYEEILKILQKVCLIPLNPPKPPIFSDFGGEVGEIERNGSKKPQNFLSGFENIRVTHVEWADQYLNNHPDTPKTFFRLELQDRWGKDIPDVEIDQVYHTLLNRRKGGGKN